jgi:sugar/nucleoside kinase (ribokinase family)
VIVCVGLATRDTIWVTPRHPAADDRIVAAERVVAGGGPAATAAVAAARLGAQVRFVGIVDGGLDDVDVVHVPGRMMESTILVGEGTRAIVTEEPPAFDIPSGALEGADWVHVDHVGYRAVPDVPAGARLSVDGGVAIEDIDHTRIDLYAPPESKDDGRRAKLTVVTRGERGCIAYAHGETIEIPGYPVDAVSTLGAGDVFHGALLACLERGLDLRDALELANKAAALSCRALDGRSGIPTWEELAS